MTDKELIARLRAGVANADRDASGERELGGVVLTMNDAADRIEALVKERGVAVKVARNEIGWRERAEARAERLEAAIRELKRCWYQGDLTENDFAAALKGADNV